MKNLHLGFMTPKLIKPYFQITQNIVWRKYHTHVTDYLDLTSISFETNSENNNFHNNEEVSAFGGCSEAISLLGCNFNFGGTLIEDICPVIK